MRAIFCNLIALFLSLREKRLNVIIVDCPSLYKQENGFYLASGGGIDIFHSSGSVSSFFHDS
ncbi:hypothetical protein IJT10_07925 [bacterium]|nr:hypothetical protein [bacterium]